MNYFIHNKNLNSINDEIKEGSNMPGTGSGTQYRLIKNMNGDTY
jgi:hypothetical protein